MNRREFCRHAMLGLAAVWWAGQWGWAGVAPRSAPGLRLALLADAHLTDGSDRRPEALGLMRAVAEIKALNPPPDLVLFAGDLAHDGHPGALALGRELLAELPAPLLAVRGEGDGEPGVGGAWTQLFGSYPALYQVQGLNVVSLYTSRRLTPQGPLFTLGEFQRRWLGRTLASLCPETPLLILTHAPLAALFRPWGHWTGDSGGLVPLLRRFSSVLMVHGHGHHLSAPDPASSRSGAWAAGAEDRSRPLPVLPRPGVGLPSLSRPSPSPLQGTPGKLLPGQGPRGCGWLELSLRGDTWVAFPHLWTL